VVDLRCRYTMTTMPSTGPEPDHKVLAHHLRGAVGVVRGHVRLLLSRAEEPLTVSQRQSLEAIDRQTVRLEQLIEQLEMLHLAHEVAPAPTHTGSAGGVGDPSQVLEPLTSEGQREQPLRPRILAVDDDAEQLDMVSRLLSDRYDVTLAGDGAEALELLRQQTFELALVDLSMPSIDGFQLAEVVAASAPRRPAVMFVSGEVSARAKVRALALGAWDYVTKPCDPDELRARVARTIAAVQREASLREDALHDPLTGLANYRSFFESLNREMERATRYDQPLSLLTLDVDDLKRINDEGGHAAGDEALQLIARILKRAVRSFDLVARQGGDEFAILLPNTSAVEGLKLAERLRAAITRYQIRGRPLSASIGVAERERGSAPSTVRSLFEASDQALYRAKRGGRNRAEGPAGGG
jgi:two-component system, cell cycle response regulator